MSNYIKVFFAKTQQDLNLRIVKKSQNKIQLQNAFHLIINTAQTN